MKKSFLCFGVTLKLNIWTRCWFKCWFGSIFMMKRCLIMIKFSFFW